MTTEDLSAERAAEDDNTQRAQDAAWTQGGGYFLRFDGKEHLYACMPVPEWRKWLEVCRRASSAAAVPAELGADELNAASHRIGLLLSTALTADHPAMLDWARIAFALRKLAATPAPPQAVPATDAERLLHGLKFAREYARKLPAGTGYLNAMNGIESAIDWLSAAPVAVDAALELPPLPRPFVPGDEFNPRDYFVPQQMIDYARAAIRAAGAGSREPLTDAQAEDCIDEANRLFNGRQRGPCGQQMTTYDDWKYWLIRAVERAHGIAARGKA